MTNDVGESDKEVPKNGEFLELYKLHAELADRVSQRREGANRLHAGLLVGLMVAASAMLKLVPSGESVNDIFLIGCGVLGAILSLSWCGVIRSYQQLNRGKFKVLRELEKHLAYPFFTREWQFLEEGADDRSYWKLTTVETTLPVIFLVLSVLLIIMSWVA